MKYRLMPVIAGLLLSAVIGTWSISGFASAATTSPLTATGTVETDDVRITTQIGGRIESLPVDEGDEVKSGQIVAHLDDVLLQAQLKQAQAALAGAKAQLAQVQAGATAADIHKAEAAVALATAVRDGAQVAWADAKAARDNPQTLNLQLAAAQVQVAIAEQKVAQATANVQAAQIDADNWGRLTGLVGKSHTVCFPTPQGQSCQDFGADKGTLNDIAYQWNLSSQRLASAYDTLGIAKAGYGSAQANLAALQAQAGNPLGANAQVDSAQAQYQSAEASLKVAEAALALTKAGASPEQVKVAETSVAQAQAAVQAIQVQIDKTTLISPISGLVTTRNAEQGEMALPGVSLLTIANLDVVRLTLYIPETDIPRVKVGQQVTVRVDSFPSRAFAGQVSFISPQAEFTPSNTQTQEERAKLVFAIKVSIANSDHALKPGMFANAQIEE